jgi:5-methylthioadenosine/S-adenosylhomocysteine deaminase
LGIIQQGALADLVLLSTSKPHFHPRHDLVANIAYCAKASDVEMVVVDGEICVEQGRLLHIDLPQLYAQVDASVRRITQQ